MKHRRLITGIIGFQKGEVVVYNDLNSNIRGLMNRGRIEAGIMEPILDNPLMKLILKKEITME